MRTFINQILYILMIVTCCGGLSGCDDKEFKSVVFTGDSIVERWDLQNSFPVLITKNRGKGGTGLDYLQSLAGKFEGEFVVVLSGTNNSAAITTDEKAKEYAVKYVQALNAFNAKTVYSISVLPRHFKSDQKDLDLRIRRMNAAILTEISESGTESIIWLDVYNKFLDSDGILNPNLSYDGLHLSPEGYEILTKELNKYLL